MQTLEFEMVGDAIMCNGWQIAVIQDKVAFINGNFTKGPMPDNCSFSYRVGNGKGPLVSYSPNPLERFTRIEAFEIIKSQVLSEFENTPWAPILLGFDVQSEQKPQED